MITLNTDILRQIAPRRSGSRATNQASIIAAVGPALQTTCTYYAIDTGLRAAHFLAQLCMNSMGSAQLRNMPTAPPMKVVPISATRSRATARASRGAV